MVRVLLALLTFAFGLALAKLWGNGHSHDLHPAKVEARETPAATPLTQAITFKRTGEVNEFRTRYLSSDGVGVSYSCVEYESADAADRELPSKHPTHQGYVERTDKLDERGGRVGRRTATAWPEVGRELDAHIAWTEGPRLSYIDAPSLKYARLFEESRAWAGQGCINFESMRRESQPAAQPNKSFEPTAR
jgi:hypothetical protein